MRAGGWLATTRTTRAVTKHAFEVLHQIAAKRLELGRLTVIDATNVQPEARRPLVELARQYHCLPVAIVLDLPEPICHERNRARADRSFGPHVVRNQKSQLRRSLRSLRKEGFRYVFTIERPEEADAATVERTPLWNDRRDDHGPFDIIGDVHGCCDELESCWPCSATRSWRAWIDGPALERGPTYAHPLGRKAVFLGDLVDRGPRILDVVRLVRNMVRHGSALCIPGNHDVKLVKKLRGHDVRITHGLAQTLAEIEALPDDDRSRIQRGDRRFPRRAGEPLCPRRRQARRRARRNEGVDARPRLGSSARLRPLRRDDRRDRRFRTARPSRLGEGVSRSRHRSSMATRRCPTPEWLNRTVNIDTGCVFGGKLTALRYPERVFVSVPAAQTYCEPARPFIREDSGAPACRPSRLNDDLLDAEDVLGKRIISTRLRGNVTIREENAAAALEVMSRFAVDPKWLIYLPPTMSPCETSDAPGLLEHPAEAFAYYRGQNAAQVICQEKHMGSRAVVIVCRDEASARARFGVTGGRNRHRRHPHRPAVLQRAALERAFLDRVCGAMDQSGLWSSPGNELGMPRLRADAVVGQGAGTAPRPVCAGRRRRAGGPAPGRVGPASGGRAARRSAKKIGARSSRGNLPAAGSKTSAFMFDAYRRYCWRVDSLLDLKLAPFHLLATEGCVHTDKDHRWHMETLARLAQADPELLLPTPFLIVDLSRPAQARPRASPGGKS